MGTLCTAKKPLIYGDGDTLHCQKAPHIWRWGHFAPPQSPAYMAMGTLCTAKKPLTYGDGDGLHCQKGPHIWQWGHFALPKSPSYMAMGTLCTAKKPLIYGDGDTLHFQKAPHIRRWGHFALPKCGISSCSVLSLAKFAENARSPGKSRFIAMVGIFRLENFLRPWPTG